MPPNPLDTSPTLPTNGYSLEVTLDPKILDDRLPMNIRQMELLGLGSQMQMMAAYHLRHLHLPEFDNDEPNSVSRTYESHTELIEAAVEELITDGLIPKKALKEPRSAANAIAGLLRDSTETAITAVTSLAHASNASPTQDKLRAIRALLVGGVGAYENGTSIEASHPEECQAGCDQHLPEPEPGQLGLNSLILAVRHSSNQILDLRAGVVQEVPATSYERAVMDTVSGMLNRLTLMSVFLTDLKFAHEDLKHHARSRQIAQVATRRRVDDTEQDNNREELLQYAKVASAAKLRQLKPKAGKSDRCEFSGSLIRPFETKLESHHRSIGHDIFQTLYELAKISGDQAKTEQWLAKIQEDAESFEQLDVSPPTESLTHHVNTLRRVLGPENEYPKLAQGVITAQLATSLRSNWNATRLQQLLGIDQ